VEFSTMAKEESVLDSAINYAFDELERSGADLSKLPVPLQTVVLVTHAQGLIDNGSFKYFFENDMPGNPPYRTFSDAYRHIGATKAADLLDLAANLFPFENSHLSSDKRNEHMDSLDESDELFAIGDEVCGDQSIWQKLEIYITEHASLFHIPPSA
jgi:hypothetical protein